MSATDPPAAMVAPATEPSTDASTGPSTGPSTAAGRPALIVDCDPGHDDALALFVAARHGDLLGITTVAGNASLDHTTRNALIVAALAGLEDVPVHAGASRPLVAPPRHGEQIHGRTGLDGPVVDEPTRTADGDDAVGFIVDTVRSRPPGTVWLVPVGPATNIALALRRAPDLAARLAGISFMGGSRQVGNVTPTAEFNVWADPEAAAVMVGAPAPRTVMSGLDLTRQLSVDDAFIDRLRPFAARGHAVARFTVALLEFYLDRQQAMTGRRLGPAHDVCSVLAITHPTLLTTTAHPVDVELHGRLTRGMTVVDERPRPPGDDRTIDVGHTLDAPACFEVLFDAIVNLGDA